MIIRLGKVCVKQSGEYVCRNVPFSPNRLNAMHWAGRSRWSKAWQEEVYWRCRENRVKITQGKAHITISLYTTRPADEDNATASIKCILDGLKGLAIKDDAPEYLSLKVETIKVNKKIEERVEITL